MQLISKHLIKNTEIGMHGNLFGGFMMQYLDVAGAILAMQTCKSSKLVTKFTGNINFEKPVQMGDIVEIFGEVEYVGRTSIKINLEAYRTDLYSEDRETVCFTSMTFVRISKNSKPRAIDMEVREHFKKLGKLKEQVQKN